MISSNVKNLMNDLGNVELVAVTKRRTINEIKEAVSAGVRHIGENYVAEAYEKYPQINGVKKHFIGRIQSNKIGKIIDIFDVIQTVDSLRHAKKIDRCGKVVDVMVQVNTSLEKSKGGVDIGSAAGLYLEMSEMENLNPIGVMTIASKENPRECFRRLASIGRKICAGCVSMGMTNDYKIAIEEGSNMVRIGRKIFEGDRG